MARRRKNSGFTLMELVLVMLVLAVCAAIATPAMRGFTRARRLPNTAQEFATAARWCHVQAITEGATYRLNLDVKGSKWSVTKDDGTGKFISVVKDFMPAETALADGVVMQTDIPVDADGLQYISFDAGGRSDVGIIQFLCDGAEVDVACDTAMSSYHVVSTNG